MLCKFENKNTKLYIRRSDFLYPNFYLYVSLPLLHCLLDMNAALVANIKANIPVSEKRTDRPASPTIGIKQYPNTETTVPKNNKS